MSSFQISHIDLEYGEDSSSCDYDYDFHSAVRSFCGESEIAESESESEHSGPIREKDCRICRLGLESSRRECGEPMVLGCFGKDDLGFVHKHCAETWFKIKGNKTCEICRSIARNFSEIDDQTTVETNLEDIEAGNSSTVVATKIPMIGDSVKEIDSFISF